MTRLTQGMYGSEMSRKSNLFGLRCGQMHAHPKFTHNSGWFNKAGEKLGWGDLSGADMLRIAGELKSGETFTVLGEGDSYWELCGGDLSESNPGLDYIEKCAMYVLIPGKICNVNKWNDNPPATIVENGCIIYSVKPSEVRHLITTGKRR